MRTGVGVNIDSAQNLRDNETIFGYENGDLSKRVDLRITGVLSELLPCLLYTSPSPRDG